jgi:non-specific serine/threonine protein kinase/serine/threonine-protein kinase
VGAYEIVALIGSGGMGDVYRARRIDAQYEKEVAIKLVPTGLPAAFVLKRMRAERQILARLDHPNIAQLIDGGATEEGLPYLVMDLIDGLPLDRYCEEHQLSVRKRLQLFRDVCSAVSHAHQHLIVHRDLKPPNILVTADGSVKLLDFGIAKLLQPDFGPVREAQTVTSVNTLTLDFASPEQVLGKTITTASDVYSLGVILYLLLTRRMPYLTNMEPLHEAIREICETEPLRPSAAIAPGTRSAEKLDADLDAITLRALRKEPDKRYRSVDEFSEDVRRYLEGLPVTARGGELAYRAGKFVRRRKLEIVAAGLFAMMLTGGIAASLYQAHLAEEQRARAERHVATVRGFAELSMFQLHDAIKDLPGSTAARELLVKTAQQYLGALASEAHRDRTLQHDIAMAYTKVADIQGKAYSANTGQPKEAIESYDKAIELLEPLVAADPTEPSKRTSLAQSYLQRSRLLLQLGESKKAVAGSKRATEIFESLARADPGAATRTVLADAVRVHALNLTLDGGSRDAIPYVTRAVAILEDLHRQQPGDVRLEYQLAVAYGSAADVMALGDLGPQMHSQSLELRLKALEVDEHLVALTQGRNATYVRAAGGDHVNLCAWFSDAGDFARAVEQCRAAQPLLQALRTDDKNAQGRLDVATLDWNLASALIGARRMNEASTLLEANVRTLEDIEQQTDTVEVQYLLAACEQALGTIHADRAASARPGSTAQLRGWRTARDWFGKAVPRFERVTSRVTLEYPDRKPMDSAIAGLDKSRAEIARLEGATKQ